MSTTTVTIRHELDRARACLYRAWDADGHLNARHFTRNAVDHLRRAGAIDLADQAEYGLYKSIGHPFNTSELLNRIDTRLAIAEFTSH